jgi:alpha-D-ribose 1-methylphosphonate 5-triphosphate synthase subunit PhnL
MKTVVTHTNIHSILKLKKIYSRKVQGIATLGIFLYVKIRKRIANHKFISQSQTKNDKEIQKKK